MNRSLHLRSICATYILRKYEDMVLLNPKCLHDRLVLDTAIYLLFAEKTGYPYNDEARNMV